uniref:Uncharacterized protein n=1 Tax=Rhizophora mucronata TaxID=61149 RepID=A0A2P2PG74_RHIMU
MGRKDKRKGLCSSLNWREHSDQAQLLLKLSYGTVVFFLLDIHTE